MFYPQDSSHLRQLLAKFYSGEHKAVGSLGIVSPHAGYIYSGNVAAEAFATVNPGFSGTFIVLGPSHRGGLTCASSIPWDTPLGVVETDTDLIKELDITVDELSHHEEHSIEVQIPFIKYRFPSAKIAPVMMGQQDLLSAKNVAERLVSAIAKTKRDVRIVASSDFSHYVSDKKARSDDLYAIEPLTTLNVKEFYHRIEDRQVTACGYGPIAAMAMACEKLGAKVGQLIHYATSGDVTGDRREVVGYAAIAVM
jgi:AmmeMemoRadiSam system protein B